MRQTAGILFSAIFLTGSLQSADVVWNCLDGTECYDFGGSHRIWISLGYETAPAHDENHIEITSHGNIPEFIGNWVVATLGEIACEETTRHHDNYFYHAYIDNSFRLDESTQIIGPDEGPLNSSGTITVAKGKDFYLMFAVQENPDWRASGTIASSDLDVYYGWLQFHAGLDGTVAAGASALDLSGGPMIVGGGSALTPEPSGALMLLLGGGALALRRRLFPSSGGRRKSEK